VCVLYCIYLHAHTCLVIPPPPQTHTKRVLVCMLTTIQTQTKKIQQTKSNHHHLRLYTRVSTHLIMALFTGKKHPIRSHNMCHIHTPLNSFASPPPPFLPPLQPKNMRVEGGKGGGGREKKKKELRGVCMWHMLCLRIDFVT